MKSILSWAVLMGFSLGVVAQEAVKPAAEAKKVEAKETAPGGKASEEVAVIKTDLGEMVVQFWPEVAPKTVENFKKLAKQGFYDGTAFHRVIKGFMIQGGDPNTKDPGKAALYGQGDPGYKINAEFNDRKHVRGVLSMARSGDPIERTGAMPGPAAANSAGSQFFIVHATAPHLDGRYTAFGKLLKGEEVLDKIANVPVGGPQRSTPIERVGVVSVKIVPAETPK